MYMYITIISMEVQAKLFTDVFIPSLETNVQVALKKLRLNLYSYRLFNKYFGIMILRKVKKKHPKANRQKYKQTHANMEK